MDQIALRPDCAACAALCCMALAFDRSESFAIDKDAGRACPHLDPRGLCAIHGQREARGFGGCVAFDCLGAGQRVTRDFFGGRRWWDDPTLVDPMTRTFSTLLRAHDSLHLLAQAAGLALSAADRARLEDLRARIGEAGARDESIDALRRETQAFLESLRGYVTERG